jgi:hypothetical protein
VAHRQLTCRAHLVHGFAFERTLLLDVKDYRLKFGVAMHRVEGRLLLNGPLVPHMCACAMATTVQP